MPGKVVRVLVNVGDAVEAGQGLVVVEAMKMQNEMKASRPGRVVEIRAARARLWAQATRWWFWNKFGFGIDSGTNGNCPLFEDPSVSRSRSWLAILLVGAAVIVAWVATKRAAPPEVEFVKVTRETLISSLSTNGKVEPIEWMPVRSERAGLITRVLVSRGQQVTKDQPLVELDTRVASADLAKAQAAIQEAKAQEQVLTQGGRIAERQQIDSDLARARLDLDAAQKNYQALDRLVAKQAATRQELDSARQLGGSTPVENPGSRKKQGRARHRHR